MGSPADFDHDFAGHTIAPSEQPAAVAAWLHQIARGNGRTQQVEPPADDQDIEQE
jgi:hypothetical protein